MRISDAALNRFTVLKAIRRKAPVARTDLRQFTGLSSSTITMLTAPLVASGNIIERTEAAEKGRSRGRPRVFLEINPEGPLAIGASLDTFGCMNVAFADLTGQLRHRTEIAIERKFTIWELIEQFTNGLRSAIDSAPFDRARIAMVGIAIPAVLDRRSGDVHAITSLEGDAPVPFSLPISQSLGLPVVVENEVTCMARAEHWFGRAIQFNDFILVRLGSAVGASEFVDGLPKSGANGFNPEFGHIKVNTSESARVCFCGKRGCLTAYASKFGVLRSINYFPEGTIPLVADLDRAFSEVLDRVQAGDRGAIAALGLAGKMLGIAIANLITWADPGHLVVSVSGARFLEAIEEPFLDVLREHASSGLLNLTKIELVVADRDWLVRGTAALALEKIYIG